MTRGTSGLVIAGGGTAGHTLPAVAVARALVERGHAPEDVLFVGSRRGLEARLVPEAGFPIVLLPGRGIARRLTAANIAAVAGLLWAVVRALVLLVRRRPAAVLSVGGYASVPCAVAAVVLRVPLVLAESNGVAGAANRLVGRFARAAAVAFPGTGLPREVVTGNPVRPEILAAAAAAVSAASAASAAGATPAARAAARDALGLPLDRVVIAVTGGSLGARRINEAVVGLADLWAGRADVAIHHVFGSRDWATARLATMPDGGLLYHAVEYEDRMPQLLAAADVFVGRAGGTTLAEVTVMGLPSILVPLPIAPNDHQAVGARNLVDAGAAIMVRDDELTPDRLAAELDPLVTDPARRARMAAAARALGHPDAASRVADLLEEQARVRR